MALSGRYYVKVRCEPCGGTGRLKRRPGKGRASLLSDSQRSRPRCFECFGYGYLTMRVVDRLYDEAPAK